MIVTGFQGFSKFGTPSAYQSGKDCPAGGSWEAWCDCMYQAGSDLHRKCHTPSPGFWACTGAVGTNKLCYAPWTDSGALARGLPKDSYGVAGAIPSLTTEDVGNVVTAVAGAATPPVTTSPEAAAAGPSQGLFIGGRLISREAYTPKKTLFSKAGPQPAAGGGGVGTGTVLLGVGLIAAGLLYTKFR